MAGKPLVLIIRDGWGVAPPGPGNAVAHAKTPYHDQWRARYATALLKASGTAIGLPEGFQGNSEVGHLNIGAGRAVKQEMTYIHEAIADGSFFKNEKLRAAFEACREEGRTLHLLGILQDAGVHAHQEHLYALLKLAEELNVVKVVVHVLADGRDSPPRSVLGFVKLLKDKFPHVTIGSLAGRYFLDRARHWQLTETLYRALTQEDSLIADTIERAVADAYTNHRAPNGQEMFDEYLPAYRIAGFRRIEEDDTVIFFHFRQDRMIQLTRAFAERRFGGPRVHFLTLTRPYDEFPGYCFCPHDESGGLTHVLGEVISNHRLRQLRIADGQKFRHVTSFLNGKRIAAFAGEDRLELRAGPSAEYRERPGMGAEEIAAMAPEIIRHGVYDFIVINFANADMVGHVGEFELAVRAVEIVDACVGKVIDAVREVGGEALITADHGNVEHMIEEDSAMVRTAHSINPVECFYVSDAPKGTLAASGVLPSLAPTILDLLDIPVPPEMTAPSLLIR